MTVRPAKVADIPRILDVIEAAHVRSIYADRDQVDRDYARILFCRAMRFNGGHGDGACLFLVSEIDGQVEGYFFGTLDRTYQVGKKLCAQEVHFYLSADADERDALRILNRFVEWADENDRVVETRIGTSNVLGEPDPRFEALLERKGFARGATVFTRKAHA